MAKACDKRHKRYNMYDEIRYSMYDEIAISDILYPEEQRFSKDDIRYLKDDIKYLAESIKSHGLISPIRVFYEDGIFILAAGRKRLFACRKLGWLFIPVIVCEEDSNYIITNLER